MKEKQKKRRKRLVAFLLVFTMVFTSFDVAAVATAVESTVEELATESVQETTAEEAPEGTTETAAETATEAVQETTAEEAPESTTETAAEAATEGPVEESTTELTEEDVAAETLTEEAVQVQTDAENTILCEEVEERTETSKTFRQSDGSFLIARYSMPVHYQNEEGGWEEIDTGLAEDGEDYATTEKDGRAARVRFSKKLKEGKTVSIKHTDHPISWGLSGAEKQVITLVGTEEAEKKGNDRFLLLGGLSRKVKYEDVYENVDVEYIVQSGGIKENIILKAPGTGNVFHTVYDIGDLSPASDGTAISLLDGEEEVYRIDAPYMVDAAGERCSGLTLSFEKTGNKEITVAVTADAEWLAAEERAYPVTIDPYVLTETSKSSIDSTFITKDLPDANYSKKLELLVGRESSEYGYCRTLVKFGLPELEAGDMVVDARLCLVTYKNDFYSSGTPDLQVSACRITEDWSLGSVTWNTKPSNSSTVLDYDHIERSEAEKTAVKYFNITKAVKNWYEGSYENYGIMLKSHSESGTWAENGVKGYFWPERYNDVSDAYPVIQISYRNNKGLEDYWTYTSVSAGRAGTAHINDYTGNLVFIHDAVSTTGLRLPVSVQHVYNGYMRGTKYVDIYPTDGRGWKTNMQQTVKSSSEYGLSGTAETNYPYAYEDGDGTVHFFYKKTEDGGTKYLDEDGLGLELTVSGSKKTITDKDGNEMIFNSYGHLTDIKDASGNKVTISYTENELGKQMITTIKDGAGHVVAYTPNTSGSYLLRTVEGPDGKYVKYYYTTGATDAAPGSGYLVRVKYSDIDEETNFTYDDYGALAKVTSADGSGLEFGYTSGTTGRRVKSVTEFGTDGTAGQKMTFDRKYVNRTMIRTSGKDDVYGNDDDIKTTMLFDDHGRTINARSETYGGTDFGGEVYTYTGGSGDVENNIRALNRVTGSGYTGRNVRNYLKNHSGETDSTWYEWTWCYEDSVYTASRTTAQRFFGNYSYKLDCTSTPVNGGGSWSQKLSSDLLRPGETYTFSGYIKTASVTKANDAASGYGACLAVRFEDEDGAYERMYSDFIKGTTDTGISNGWRRISLTFTVPEGTVETKASMVLRNAEGTAWFDGLQMEDGTSVSAYNLLENAGFEETDSDGLPDGWTVYMNESGDGTVSVAGTKDSLSMKFAGDAADTKRVSQQVNVGGTESDIYILSGWGKANALEDPEDGKRYYDMYVRVYYSDGTNILKDTRAEFSRDVSVWQRTSVVFDLGDGDDDTEKTPTKVNVGMRYYRQENTVYFDNAQLVKDVSNSYTYDEEGNLTAVSAGEGEDSAFVYNSSNDLTSIKDAKDNKYQYTYDDKHRVTGATAPMGQIMEFTYGTGGNVTQTLVGNSGQDKWLKTETGYNAAEDGISAGTYVASQTDETGKTSTFEHDVQSGQLKKAVDKAGTETSYTYKTGTDLLTEAASEGRSVTYSYDDLNEHLTDIGHNGTTYAFSYDIYGNLTEVTAGGKTLVTNTYASNNGKQTKSTYGNGDEKEYAYDSAGNLSSVSVNGTKEHEWGYGSSQEPVLYKDLESGRETAYGYDITGRIAGIRVHDGDITSTSKDSRIYQAEYAYDVLGSVEEEIVEAGGHSHGTSYTYNKNGQPVDMTAEGITVSTGYDSLGRLLDRTVSLDTELCYDYSYKLSGWNEDGGDSYRTTLLTRELIGDLGYAYSYDDNGNLLTIKEGTRREGTASTVDGQVLKASYVYDGLGQLVRENNVWSGKTVSYSYDNGGNLTARKEYAYTTAADLSPLTPLDTVSYGYGSGWKDLMVSYDGSAVTYDTIGNPLTYRGWTFDWEGRDLISAAGPGSITYTYDADGIRTSKTVDGTEYSYYYSGGRLSYEKRGTKELFYFYDAYGNLAMIRYYNGSGTGTLYHAVTNTRGDVEMLYGEDGSLKARYYYDAWGDLISIKDGSGNEVTSTGHIGHINPIRYRGYYYDAETGFYYVSSRYYDPEIGRFISADTTDILGVSSDLYDKNLYAYCDNNPVAREDVLGMFWIEVIGVVAAGGVVGGLMGALSAAATGGNIREGIVEGIVTGAAGSAMGLAKWNPIVAGFIGAGIDIGVQIISQNLSHKKIDIDYGRAVKTGIQTGMGVKIPAFGEGTENVVNAIGTAIAWAETTVLIVSADIIYTNWVTAIKRNTVTVTQSYAYSNTRRTGKMMR